MLHRSMTFGMRSRMLRGARAGTRAAGSPRERAPNPKLRGEACFPQTYPHFS